MPRVRALLGTRGVAIRLGMRQLRCLCLCPKRFGFRPHPIYLAELEYRAAATGQGRHDVLERYKDVVTATADFMAVRCRGHWRGGGVGWWLAPGRLPVYAVDTTGVHGLLCGVHVPAFSFFSVPPIGGVDNQN